MEAIKITTQEEYDKIPDGHIFRVLYTGRDWCKMYGRTEKVTKQGDKLFTDEDHYVEFSERNDDIGYIFDFSFQVFYSMKDNKHKKLTFH
jgi:hypothetical protein